MGSGKWFGARAVAGLAVLTFGVGGATAATFSLQDLLDGSPASFVSDDGAVEFSEFAYVAGVNAPDAADIDLITDASVPQGFRVVGSFSVSGTQSLNALLGFEVAPTGGSAVEFVDGTLALEDSVVTGGTSGMIGSSAFVTAKVDSLINDSVAILGVVESEVQTGVFQDTESLAGFGNGLGVLVNPSLQSVEIDSQTPAEATINEFSVNFAIPEPATIVLLSLAGMALLRRRR
jgi:hypothetical protein